MMKYGLNLIFLFLLTFIAACGDAKKDTSGEKFTVTDSRLSVSCTLSADRLKKFLEQNVYSEIDCLAENLNLFMRLVDTEKPGYLSQKQLKIFIKDRKTDIDPKSQIVIDMAFDIVHLIFGDEKGQLSADNVRKLTKFLKDVNNHGILIKSFIDQKGEIPFSVHMAQRTKLANSLNDLTEKLSVMVKEGPGLRTYGFDVLLDRFTQLWPDKKWDRFKSLYPLKSLLLGGEKGILTNGELLKLLQKIPPLITMALDLYRFSDLKMVKEEDRFILMQNNLDTLKNDILDIPWGQNKVVLTLNDIAFAMDTFYDDMFDEPKSWSFKKYLSNIGKIKAILMDEEGDITGKQFSVLFAHIQRILYEGVMTHKLWTLNQNELSSIKEMDMSKWKWGQLNPDKNFKEKILRVVSSYKFYKGDKPAPMIDHDYHRNAKGLFEFMAWEYGLLQVFKRYGCQPSATPTDCLNKIKAKNGVATGLGFSGEYVINLEGLKNLLYAVEPMVVEWGWMLPNYVPNMAENITLLSSLFIYQSNGDSFVTVNEAAEFFLALFSAIDIGTEMHKELSTMCQVTSKKRIEPKCYRKHLFDLFATPGFNGHDYSQYFPGLFTFANTSLRWSLDEYVLENERAAMVCPWSKERDPQDIIPKSKGDLISYFVTMLTIETTIIRFDINRNNQMDPDELDTAYAVYQPAVEGVIKTKMGDKIPMFGGITPEAVYRFLVAEERVPTASDLANMVTLLVKCDRCIAKRKTIASILKNIKLNSHENSSNPFNCASLKD